ncbi:MAG: Kelch repeat-containing protein [Candidatus Sulfotelmatobacter sp.]
MSHRALRTGLYAALFLGLFLSLAAAQIPATDDSYTASSNPNSNYGAQSALDVIGPGVNSYIRFDLTALPAGLTGANVSKATVRLNVNGVTTAGTFDVYEVTKSWTEGAITYSNAPALGTKVNGAVMIPTSKRNFIDVDVTQALQDWLNGTQGNYGIALVPSSGSSISVSFDSKENTSSSHDPELTVSLISAGPQGPAGPPGAAGATGAQGPQGVQGLMGLPGATGSQGPAGPVGANGTGFNFRNAFDNSASYAVNDVVTFQGASYVATTANQGPNNPTPDQNSSGWSVMAAQGTVGAAGAQGPSGSAGPAGPAGPVGPIGPQGPVGPMPQGAALTNAANTFTTSQTIGGSLVLTGAGSGIQFADGTVQNSAATGSTPPFVVLGNSPAAPAGYTLSGVISTGNTWFQVAPMQTARYGPAAASVSGLMYAIGGAIGGANGLVYLNSVEVYNAASWSTAASMPTARDYLAAAAVNGLIYAIGGANGSSPSELNTVEVYNPASNSWTTGAPMPTARYGLAAAVVNGLIYAIGGLNSSGSLKTVEVYDPTSNSWTTGAPMPTAREFLGAASTNGLIYAMGGVNGVADLNTVEVYNPTTNSWTTAAGMPTGRGELAADAMKGLVYALGGSNGPNSLNTAEVYNPTTNSWSTAAAMPTAAFGLAAADINGLVYAIGGVSPGNVYSNAVAQYAQPVTVYLFTKN